jgi:hypothetical protein
MRAPAVTVVLPVYNGEAFVGDAVRSILSQTSPDLELVIVDDGSTDHTSEILSSFPDDRIRIQRHRENAGLVRSLNDGIAAARAPFIARIDADDWCFPHRLERQLAYFSAHPDTVLLGSSVELVSATGNEVVTRRVIDDNIRLRWRLFFTNHFIHPTMMFRRELVIDVGRYDEAAFPAEDYDLWLRMAPHGRLGNIVEPLVRKRQTTASLTTTRRDDQVDLAITIRTKALSELLQREIDKQLVHSIHVSQFSTCTEWLDALRLFEAVDRAIRARTAPSLVERLRLTVDTTTTIERLGMRSVRGNPCRVPLTVLPRRHLVPLRRTARRLRNVFRARR